MTQYWTFHLAAYETRVYPLTICKTHNKDQKFLLIFLWQWHWWWWSGGEIMEAGCTDQGSCISSLLSLEMRACRGKVGSFWTWPGRRLIVGSTSTVWKFYLRYCISSLDQGEGWLDVVSGHFFLFGWDGLRKKFFMRSLSNLHISIIIYSIVDPQGYRSIILPSETYARASPKATRQLEWRTI